MKTGTWHLMGPVRLLGIRRQVRLHALGACIEALFRLREAMSAGKPMADAASTLTELRVSLSRLCTGSEVSAVAEQKHTPKRRCSRKSRAVTARSAVVRAKIRA